MIVPMTKLKLVGLTYHENRVLDALHKTGLVDISLTTEIPETDRTQNDGTIDIYREKFDRINRAVDFYYEYIEKAKGTYFYPKNINDYKNFIIPYDEFMSVYDREGEIMDFVAETEKYSEQISDDKQQISKLKNLLIQLMPYSGVENKFSDYKDTKLTKVFFGTIRRESLVNIDKIKETDAYYQVVSDTTPAVIVAVSFNSCADSVSKILNENGFMKCPFDYDETAKSKSDNIQREIDYLEKRILAVTGDFCKKVENIKDLKILSDYYRFLIEKQNDILSLCCTKSTFVLEGYFPEGNEETVRSAICEISDAVFIEFSKPTKEDNPPTLTRNNKVVRQAEFVTDMYSSPQYTEVDPNKPVFFFFVLFMGVIMADVVYGIVMIALGLFLAGKNKIENSAKKLWTLIAYGGVFTLLIGFLFNSFLGFSVLPFTLLPSPVPDGNGTDNLKVILLLCLALGVLQIMVGYLYKGFNALKNKDVLGFLFDGILWIIFFIGFILAASGFLLDYLLSDEFAMNPAFKKFLDDAQFPGIIIVLASLGLAVLTAGRNERGFGKFTKGFGSVYGLINLFSDILSYARLFGLLLSGMIIAQTFNDIGSGLFSLGFFGYIFGVLVIIAGHAFNLAMGVLGAYIHDSRLQYIEFFSKFYTGEGNRYSPIGSNMQYVYLKR